MSVADPLPTRRRRMTAFSDFGILSCKFSAADGNEVVAEGDGFASTGER
jgi:hypothetical protein